MALTLSLNDHLTGLQLYGCRTAKCVADALFLCATVFNFNSVIRTQGVIVTVLN